MKSLSETVGDFIIKLFWVWFWIIALVLCSWFVIGQVTNCIPPLNGDEKGIMEITECILK